MIYAMKASIAADLYLKDKKEEYYKIAEKELSNLIDDFSSSERLDSYFILLLKLYNSRSDADNISKLKSRAEQITGISDSMRVLILSSFR
jgi:hypothetical protein